MSVGEPRPDAIGVVGPVGLGVACAEGGAICVYDVLECCPAVCVVVEEEALRWVLGEDDSAPGGDVRAGGGPVSNCPELAAELQFLWFRCWAGESVPE